jgi:uncharacterized protein (TIGR03067 family)
MRNFNANLLIVLLAVGLNAAPVPKKLISWNEEALLEGRWEIDTVDTTGNGPDTISEDFAKFTFQFKDGTLTTGTEKNPGWTNVKSKLDAKANPKQIILEISPGYFVKNIYEIEGDTLKWCEWQKEDAPDNFTGGSGKNSFVLKRVREDK